MQTALIRLIALPLILATLATGAVAQAYKWKDASGRTIISDQPPPKTAKPIQIEDSAPTGSVSGKSGTPSLAERDLDFKKRQQANREKAEKDEKDKANADKTKAYCDQARRQLSQLESGERVMVREPNGERGFMDDSQRQREIANTRKDMQESCK